MAPEYPSLAKMLRVFASRGIRNRATMGGNIATASPIGDSAPVLLTLDASLVLASADGRAHRAHVGVFPRATERPRCGPGRSSWRSWCRSCRRPRGSRGAWISSRCPSAGSWTSASWRARSARTWTRRASCALARIAYGGVALTPRRARAAEAALEGRTPRGRAGGGGRSAPRRVPAHRRRARERRLPARAGGEPVGEVRERRAEHRRRTATLDFALGEKFPDGGCLPRARARERQGPRDGRRPVRGRHGPAPAHARGVAGLLRRTPMRASGAATRRRRARAPGRGGRPDGGGHPRAQQRGHRAARRAAVRRRRGALSRAARRPGGGRHAQGVPRAPRRWWRWTTSRCRRSSASRRRLRRTATTPSRTR